MIWCGFAWKVWDANIQDGYEIGYFQGVVDFASTKFQQDSTEFNKRAANVSTKIT
jgi:hypothetical protein